MKETVQERTVLKEKVAEIFINGKNTMTVADIDELKRHTGSALHAMEVREDDEDFQNPVDLMMEELEKKNPNHFAVRQYKKYRLAAGDVCSK